MVTKDPRNAKALSWRHLVASISVKEAALDLTQAIIACDFSNPLLMIVTVHRSNVARE